MYYFTVCNKQYFHGQLLHVSEKSKPSGGLKKRQTSSNIVILLASQPQRRTIHNMVRINGYSFIIMLLQEWIMVNIYIIAFSIVAIMPGLLLQDHYHNVTHNVTLSWSQMGH